MTWEERNSSAYRSSLVTSGRNPFVETTLSYVLSYISSLTKSHTLAPIQITILADNDYYSKPSTTEWDSASRFTNFNIPLPSAHKTGLGSSAALVTSLTASLMSHYLTSDQLSLKSSTGLAQLHNLSQAAHCAAQGKVGSGFDVAAAVYGTCIYRRFSPSLLSSIGEPGNAGFASKLRECIKDERNLWDTEVQKEGLNIPKGMQLLMCDVDCGSATPGMVKNVLAWRSKSQESSKKLWDTLQQANTNLASKLQDGTETGLQQALLNIRKLIKQMGEESGVEIEPQTQTDLLNEVSAVSGVIGGVVPGAGGYDAVVLLVKDDENTIRRIKSFLIQWSTKTDSTVRLLDVKGELEGIRHEPLELYQGWFSKVEKN